MEPIQNSLRVLALVLISYVSFSQTPGGVSANLSLWLKADNGPENISALPASNGEAVITWRDRSGLGRDYIGVAGPTLVSNVLNFNPAVEILSGGFDAPVSAALTTNWSVFTVSQKLASDNNGRIFDGHTSNFLWGHWGNFTNSIFLNGNPSNFNSGIATTIGIQDLKLHAFLRESAGGTLEARSDGTSLIVFPTSNSANTIRIDINQGNNAGETSDSRIGEMIIYDRSLTPAEVIQVESYLAIKYGLTINHNYVSSAATTLWDLTANAGFNTRITAIGLDAGSGLNQLQSRSLSAGAVLTIQKPIAFSASGDFVVVGDDNGSLNPTPSQVPAGFNNRIARIWRSRVSGTPGTISISFDLSAGIFNSGRIEDYALVIKNTDSDFSTGATQVVASSIANNVITFDNVTLSDGDFFTLAFTINTLIASQNPVFWVRATNGVTGVADVSNWADQSGNGKNAIQNTVANQPTLLANAVNGYPAIDFTGSTDVFSITSPPTNVNSTIFTVAVPTVNTSWRTMFRGTGTDHPIIVQSGGTQLGYFDNDNGGFRASGFTWLQNETAVVAAELRTGDVNFRKNGAQGASITTIDLTGISLNFFGNFQSGGQRFGQIAETIIFNSPTPLTTNEKEIIESYLAAKYGVTLTHNYMASTGLTYWDIAANTGFNERITVIGKDDAVGLDQRRSKSESATSVLTIEKDNVATPFSNNLDFLVVADDNGVLQATSSNLHPSRPLRVSRIWRVASTGTPGLVDLSFDLGTGIFNSGIAADYTLLINNTTPDFTTASTQTGGVLNGNVLTFSSVSLSSGSYFSLGLPQVASPGGVINNLKAWLKADAGVTGITTVSDWQDQTSNNFLATQANGAAQPTLVANRLNFNPAIQFDGLNDQLVIPGGIMGTATYSDLNVFAVTRTNTVQASSVFFETQAGGGRINAHIPWSDNNLYWDAGSTSATNRQNTNWGGSVNTGFIWSLLASTTSTALGSNQNIVRNGLLVLADGTLNTFTGNNSNMLIGSNGTNLFNGEISELLFYTGPLTAVEYNRIHSYLATKYGITLNQATPTNYTASDGSVIWDATTNVAYNNRITGIGRDDISGLDQRRSKSNSIGAIVTIEKEDISSAFTNLQFAFVSDDGASLGATTNNVVSPYPMRVTRVWRAEISGTPGNFDLTFDLGTGIFNSGVASDYALLINNTNTNFETGSTVITGGVIAGSAITFSNVSLADGAFFTLALPSQPAPGGVITGLGVWLKANQGVFADAGITPATDAGVVQRWADATSLANNATQTGNPIYNTTSNLINFNPTLYYDGTSGHNLTYSTINRYSIFTMSRLEGSLNRRVFSSRIGNALTGYWNGREDVIFLDAAPNILSGSAASTNPRLYATVRSNTGAYQMFRNGLLLYSGATSNNSNWQLGIANGGAATNESSRAYVAEVIQYDRDLNADELVRVQSYMAIKYGVTLSQTTPTNYVASDGTILWNATDNANYATDLAGIGLDQASALSQIRSQSINANSIVAIDKGGPFASNLDFIMWGSDNAFASPTTVNRHPSYPYRFGKTWRVDVTGNLGAVSITFDLGSGAYNTGVDADYALLINNTTDFATGTAVTANRTLVGNTLTFSNVALQDGEYFTLAMPTPPAPGGVTNNLALWLKANQGVTGLTNASAWEDQSGNNFNVIQNNINNQPVINTERINFNPTLQFDGANDNLSNNLGILGTRTYNDIYAFVVSRTNTVQNSFTFFENTTAGSLGFRIPWSDTNAYWEPSTAATNRLIQPWGGRINTPYLWSMAASTTATISGQRQDLIRNGFTILSDLTYTAFSGNNNAFFLGSGSGNNFFNGEVAEVVLYGGAITSTEFNRIQTYLAIKYGVTLPTTDYTSSAGTLLFGTTSTHNTYNFNVIGIGRDDVSELSQVKSRSTTETADILTIANGNFTTPVPFSNSNEFLMVGHNNRNLQADATQQTITHGGTNIDRYLSRVWSTQLTGNPTGNVIIEVDMTTVAGTNDLNAIRLVLDSDQTLGNSSAGEFTYTGTISGNLLYFNIPYSDFVTTQSFFTIASTNEGIAPLTIPTPGGITGNIRLWLHAGAGVTGNTPVTSWQDQSINAFVATTTNGPDLVTTGFNNNPSLSFTRANAEFMQIVNGITGSNLYNNAWVYVVSQPTQVVNQTLFYERMAGSNRTFNVLVPWGDANTYFDFGNSGGSGRISGAWGANVNTHFMWTFGTSTSTATPNGTRKSVYRDGAAILSNNNTDNASGSNQNFIIGAGFNSGATNTNNFDGRIAELIVLADVPSALDQERVHSYLAIKYGISKNSADNAGTPATDERDYFASNAAVLWDFSANLGFNNRITGIGRDDLTLLNQLRSQNKANQSIVTIEKTGNFNNDLDYLLWGDDNGLLGLTTTGANAILTYRTARVWRANIVNNPGEVSVSFDLGGPIFNSNSSNDYRLLIGNSPTSFTTANVISGTIIGNTIRFDGVTFNDGDFFTLAVANMPAPGGVVPNMHYWVKGDVGTVGATTVSAWNDQSGNGFNVAQATLANQPTLLNPRLNFNPSVQFDGTNDQLTLAGGILGNTTYTDFNVFAVSRVNVVSNNSLFFEATTASGRINAHLPWGDNILYWDAGSASSTQRLQINWGGSVNNSFIWNLLSSTTNTASGPGNRQEIFRNGRRIANDNTLNTFQGNNGASNFFLGHNNGGSLFNGELSELVMYRGPLSLSQMQRIQSYLAIKWGVSLDQTTPTNYVASDWNGTTGTIIWNGITAGTFRNDITVIGRDDLSALTQKQSQSATLGNLLV
ncbi:MAG: beta strand repeat-containing protein, partial [Chryseotalea sp.]